MSILVLNHTRTHPAKYRWTHTHVPKYPPFDAFLILFLRPSITTLKFPNAGCFFFLSFHFGLPTMETNKLQTAFIADRNFYRQTFRLNWSHSSGTFFLWGTHIFSSVPVSGYFCDLKSTRLEDQQQAKSMILSKNAT